MIPPNSICWEYKWLDVPLSSQTMTMSSFIQVGELKMFRLGVKCSADRKTLKVYCFSENQLLTRHFGVRLHVVACIFHSTEMMAEMVTASGHVWNRPGIFTTDFKNVPTDPPITTSTFAFHFYVKGIADSYVRERFDSFLVEKLWEAAEEQKMTDVLIKVGDRSFSSHKFVLAARSRVFQAMFETDMVEARTGIVQIDDVDPDIFRQFLRFLYTGQLDEPLSAELGAVAQKYDVKTLEALCKAVAKYQEQFTSVTENELVASARSLLSHLDALPWEINEWINPTSVHINESGGVPALFDVMLIDTFNSGKIWKNFNSDARGWAVNNQGFHVDLDVLYPEGKCQYGDVITFMSSEVKINGLSVADVAYSLEDFRMELYDEFPEKEPIRRYKVMNPVRSLTFVENEQPLEIFAATFDDLSNPNFHSIQCSARLVSTIPGFTFKFRDALYARQLWDASLNAQLTDFTIDVNGRLFAVHQALLSARCPTLVSSTRINEADESTMEELLHFLYTGTVKSMIPCPAPLLQVAEMHEVSTLKLLGQAQHRFQVDRDKLSKIMMLCCN